MSGRRARQRRTRWLGIGVAAVVVAIGAAGLATTGASRGPGDGFVTFAPASFSCSSPDLPVRLQVWLPSFVNGSEQITVKLDGDAVTTSTVSDDYVRQADGRWLYQEDSTAEGICEETSIGTHTFTVLDANGQQLARGSLTTTP